MNDPYDLARFVDAQDSTYEQALSELRRGRKTGHWMWFVFPQIEGLGYSPMAQQYAISGLDEARAYLAHPVLGPRLVECARVVAGTTGRSAYEIFGSPDDLKLLSSMTLFARAASDTAEFQHVLDRYFDGKPDERTLERL
ncbi:DUF1810 domain-containing protein [Pseudonocardia kunmingensis]|uniref:Uncharacterized protein (DUF1810 family) n=1 Tax=Pseudonocardia kunmingensis TaxID=630975 RepID=A0A543DI78_9PSEU|nr:DUF1810 domain-containing protein [Pseudonocardia kunmingensis]TQM08965.1 uncharacterized protein (DUF1810 family) [Pseudonocardia kunmingensis]